MPAYNNRAQLDECLHALTTSSYPDAEIIVVDDASTDDPPRVAARNGVRVVRRVRNGGPGAARNSGALHARGDILFFVDADVVIAPGAVGRVARVLDENPDLAAVFGSYDAQPRARGVVSQYRNLLHHFVHQAGNTEASTFWGGCGAVRRSVFRELGGFDEKRFPRPSIEDIEFGYRLRRAGYRVLLDKGLQGTHLKRWTLLSVIRTDITRRAIPWSRLILESGTVPDDLNLKRSQRLSVALVALLCVLLPLAAIRVEVLAPAAAAVLGVILLNRKLFSFFLRQRGPLFTLACIPLHLLYYLYSGLSYLFVRIVWQFRGPATRPRDAMQRG